MGEGCNIDWFTFAPVNTDVPNVESSRMFNLYPNPMDDILNIDTQENIYEIRMYNILGKMVYQGMSEKQIDTKDFKKGTYFVQLTFNDGKKISGKILK